MYKNLTTNQLVLIGMSALLLLLAAFAFYLLQDPSAPLPFLPAPDTSTPTLAPLVTLTPEASTPTPRTSYTPLAAFLTPQQGTASGPPGTQITGVAPGTTPGQSPGYTPPPQTTPGGPYPIGTTNPGGNPYPIGTARTPQPTPVRTTPATASGTPPTPTKTTSAVPSATRTLAPGEIAVTGKIFQNATPMPNVVILFADDTPQRQALTNPSGRYSFTTLAPGASFILTFRQSDNPNLTPPTEIASLINVEGTLPIGVNPITIPDIEISLTFGGIFFEPQSPIDGYSISASVINSANQLQFLWTLYSQGGSYHVELGPTGSDIPVWTSPLVAGNNYMWDGTLTDGTHITQGTYWWRVTVTKSLGNYVEVIYTQQLDIIFTP